MQSKTSFFNKTVFKKNLTRFAPAWGLYTLCLILGTLLIYSNGGTMKQFHFAANMAQMPQYMSLINLVYAPLVVQLLFGDLYSSRMCNALHAMPIRREGWFFTNILAGLTFSIVPTLVMTVLSMLLCTGSIFQNAWQIPWLVFAAANLEYICFFGIALFSAMCVGSRLSMVLIYGVLNGGAFIVYWLIDTIYTPMLYGVVTPTALAEALTPVAQMTDGGPLIETNNLYRLQETFGRELEGAVATFKLSEKWSVLFILAAVGIAFVLIALVLYKKRNLECAGDAMAFRLLEPVFQVLGAVVAAAAAQFFVSEMLGFYDQYLYIFLISGLVIGWFACRMLIERSTRVFQMKNWVGLVGLTVVIAVSLFLTHVDILGIEDWQPKAEDVKSVSLGYQVELTDREDIQKVIDIQAEALETRMEDGNAYAYIQDETGAWVMYEGQTVSTEDLAQLAEQDGRYAFYMSLVYHMESGKDVSRSYVLWADGQAGDYYREILSRWEFVNNDMYYSDSSQTEEKVLARAMADLNELYLDTRTLKASEMTQEKLTELAEDFLTAVKADCAEGNMAQNSRLHRGHFRKLREDPDDGYSYREYLSVSLRGKQDNWYIEIYPDSHHTIKWLQEHDLLDYEIRDNILIWY